MGKWESADEGKGSTYSERLEVPGGWIYRFWHAGAFQVVHVPGASSWVERRVRVLSTCVNEAEEVEKSILSRLDALEAAK